MSSPKCSATTKAGTPCRSSVWNDTDHCLLHSPDPAAREVASKGRDAGGAARADRQRALSGLGKPLTPEQALRLLSALLVDTASGTAQPGVLTSVASGLRVYFDAVQIVDFAERIAELERQRGIARISGGRRAS